MLVPEVETTAITVPANRLAAAVDRFDAMGVATTRLLGQAGIGAGLMGVDRARVTTEQMDRFLELLWQETADELFGLGSAPVPLGSFRLLAYGVHSAPTLGGQVDRLTRLQSSIPGFPTLRTRPVDGGRGVRLEIDIDYDPRPVGILVDTLLVLGHGWLSWNVGVPLALSRVEVPYQPLDDLPSHRWLFGCSVTYHARHPALVLPTELLRLPTVRTTDEVSRFLRHAPRYMLNRGRESTVSARVRTLMATAPPGSPPPSATWIAAQLAMSPQTLRRRLQNEGTSVRAIREDLLRNLAVDGLTRGEAVHVLAHRLGFAEPSTFSRAFRRWTGSPPTMYQSTHSAETHD